MRQRKREGQLRRPAIKIGIAVTASAVLSAGAASLLMAGGSGPVVLPYATMAAINTSNTTVGFADSDIIGMSQADIDRTLDEMQAMGVQNVRILIPWNGVELANDFFYWNKVDALVNSAYERNMGILGVLNSTPAWATEPGQPAPASPPADPAEYAEFVGAVAERYAGKVSAYEVWNEPNATTFWYPSPDPAEYTQLLQAAFPAIKEADPDATVIGGVVGWVTDYPGLAISPAKYVEGMYDAGAQGYFDALSYHPYQYQVPFGQGRPYGPASPINQLDLMHQEMVANGDADKQIWATEYGQPTSQGGEAKQAQFISNFLNTWSSVDYTGPSFIYTTRDRATGSTNDQDTLGVLRTDWTRKPAADVIQQWTATHPQSSPSTVAPVAATEVPQSTLTAPTATNETSTAPTVTVATEPTATATAEPTATATAEPTSRSSTTTSTSTGSTTSTSTTSSTDSTSSSTHSTGTSSSSTGSTTGSTGTSDTSGSSTGGSSSSTG
ncbi:cellulase family glycosylhydrolase [Mycobacterium sp. NPDC048908]|uniref:cellulase family glycosylhydrolase n=1 Tax=Mycobacterium sp. NPDC048908 TaxID=3364292 RepID=UPI00371C81B0